MIFVYNELETPVWSVTKNGKDHFMMKHQYSRKMNIGFGTDVEVDDIISIDEDLKEAVNHNNVCVNEFGTEIGFSAKTGAPYISKITETPTEYDRTVIFVTLDMTGKTLLNIGSKKACIYAHHYDGASNTFSVVFSLDTDPKMRSAIFVVSKDEFGDVHREVFELSEGFLSVSHRKFNPDTDIKTRRDGKPTVRLDNNVFMNTDGNEELFFALFRPRRPATNVICCSQSHINDATNLLKDKFRYVPDSHRLILHTPANSKELKKKVDFLAKHGIDYVTYYLHDVRKEELLKPEIVNKIRKNYFGSTFTHLSVLTRDGDIVHIC